MYRAFRSLEPKSERKSIRKSCGNRFNYKNEKLKFLGMLYRLKVMLPSLAVLGKSILSEVIKVSKIVLFYNGETVSLLKDDLQTRPSS